MPGHAPDDKAHPEQFPARDEKPFPGAIIVAVLLAVHGLFLIVIGLIAFFAGFAGLYNVSNGHTTPGAIIAVAGVFLAWIFLVAGIVSFLCAQGLLAGERWAFWLTLALEVIDLLAGWGALTLRLFAPWLIILNMSVAGVILLYTLIVIGPRMLSRSRALSPKRS
jgi:uncharacterized membrane protein (DUF485 family)